MTIALLVAVSYLVWLDVRPLLQRLVAVVERRYPASVAPVQEQEPVPASLPPDIEQLALGESEEWARASVRDRAWELYRHFDGDWDAAKRVLFAERHATMFGAGDSNAGIS